MPASCERLLARFLRHVGIVPGLGAGLLELRHPDSDHVDLATHACALLSSLAAPVAARRSAPARGGRTVPHPARPRPTPAPTSRTLGPRGVGWPRMGGDADAIRAYHEQTKHSPARLRSDPHALDWANMPRPFKVYVDLEPLALPRDFASSTWPALAAIADAGRAAGGLPARPPRARPPALLLGRRAATPDVSGRRDLLPRRRLHRRALPHRLLCGVRRPARPRGRRLPLRAARLRAAPAARRRPSRRARGRRRGRAGRPRARRPCSSTPARSGATRGSIAPAPIGTASGTAARSWRTCSRSRAARGCRRASCRASSTPT